MNAMNEFVKPTLVLAIICLVITALLSVSHEITQPIIQENERKTAELARAVFRRFIKLPTAWATPSPSPPKAMPATR